MHRNVFSTVIIRSKSFPPVSLLLSLLLGPLRGGNCRCLWLWQPGFGLSLRAVTSLPPVSSCSPRKIQIWIKVTRGKKPWQSDAQTHDALIKCVLSQFACRKKGTPVQRVGTCAPLSVLCLFMFCVTVVVEVLSNTDNDSNGVHTYAATIVHMCIPKGRKKDVIDRLIFLKLRHSLGFRFSKLNDRSKGLCVS